jgi:hypothetical protein
MAKPRERSLLRLFPPHLEESDPLARNILDEQNVIAGTKQADADIGGSIDAQGEAIKDKIDDAIPKGPKKADASTGGRVMVGETGDLHDLAARRQP